MQVTPRNDTHDRVSQALAQRIADELKSHPEWIGAARANLSRWTHINRDAPGLLRCYAEWESLLQLPIEAVIREMIAPTDRGQRLRTNLPFAGVLAPKVVTDIIRSASHEAKAA